jgi:hypothetical protein
MSENYPEVHPSEWSWAGWEFDMELDNRGTMEDLAISTYKLIS